MANRPQVLLSGRVAIDGPAGVREIGGHHPRALFALLAVQRYHPVARDELAEALWGDAPPASWPSSLRVSLSKVRAFLVTAYPGEAALTSDAGGYRLRLVPEPVLDVELAEEGLHVAERALAAGDIPSASGAAASARRILSATFAPGAAGHWVESRRSALSRLLVRALEAEAEALAALGDGAAAIAAAQQAVDLEPFEESAHRALIRACFAAGNKAEALRGYERCRRLLSEELGVDPAPATEAVYLRVLRDEPLPGAMQAQPAPPQPSTSSLDQARELIARREWEGAYEILARIDAGDGLVGDGLEALGDAALWTGRHAESVAARKRAHDAYLTAGDSRGGARVALALASNHGIRGELPIAEGWFRVAARLLADTPEAPEHGFLAYVASVVLFETGMLEEARAHARAAFDIGQRYAIPDLEAAGLAFQGFALARRELLDEAGPLLDEAMARATSGRLAPLIAGQIYCRTIRTWLDLFDFRRAAQWIETVQECSLTTGFVGNPGDCHAHLAAALVARGSWTEAEREADRACEECETFELSHVGLASNTLGEIWLARGELRAAEAAFRRAAENGVAPQPGLALLHLARDDSAQARASIESFLAGTADRLARARVLPAATQIALAAGDAALARTHAVELQEIATAVGAPALNASAALARGALLLNEGNAIGAIADLRAAIDLHRRAEQPYELSRARLLLAAALEAADDHVGAALERQSARAVLARLGVP